MKSNPTNTSVTRGEPPTVDRVGVTVVRRVDELRAHPSCTRHRIAVSTSRLSAAVALGDLAFELPVLTTRTGFIISGYERYVLARDHGRVTIDCLEFDLDEAESLRWLIELNRDAEGLNDFQRIQLALDLEPRLHEAAVMNQRAGGQHKGSQKLAKASLLDVRGEIASIAGVCSWNVGKVKLLLARSIPEIREAAREGEISIHRAWLWSRETTSAQREMLRRHRLKKGILQGVTREASKRRRQMLRAPNTAQTQTGDCSDGILKHLADALRAGTAVITVIDHGGSEILVPKHLLEGFRSQPEVNHDEP